MKVNNINKYKIVNFVFLACIIPALVFVACDDFLDREPLDRVSPRQYLNNEPELAAYAINYYVNIFRTHGGWDTGLGRFDDDTDNQATADADYSRYVPGYRLVPQSGSLGFNNIRAFNFFLEQVLPKWKEGKLSGNKVMINHYIGEIYMLRAMEYFNKLKTFGDFPLVKKVLTDQRDVLIEAAKRSPRNIVSRQIISDLDSAIMLMQSSKDSKFNKVRLTKEAALLAKSRVALYEASFLTYHKGTPRVPGENEWPGAKMSYNSGFSINLDEEINYFLEQAMISSKEVADAIELTENTGVTNPPSITHYLGWNPYFEMFSDDNMGKYPEIIFWRQYSLSENISHAVSIYVSLGGNTGLTKGFIESFLMKNGLPIYAPGSGYQGDMQIMDVKKERDERLQLFLFGEKDLISVKEPDDFYEKPTLLEQKEHRDVTGYRSRKFLIYHPNAPTSGLTNTGGSPVFRAAEAYLNYIEASYMKNKTIDDTAAKYWRIIRLRAGIDPDFYKTIDATDMEKEGKGDWGAYSAGELVDPVLYNIRRERRNEFVSEGMRWDDLIRWRSMDQIENYIIEGFNLWDEAYKKYPTGSLIADGSSTANVSNKNLSKYLRPYQIVNLPTNLVLNGYNWSEANYLSPIAYREMQLASPTGDAETSNLYQNPYWPVAPNAKAEK